MTVTVYGDVLAAVNFIVDLALLKLTARLTHLSCGARVYLAAALGGAMAFLIFLPPLPVAGEAALKLCSCALLLFAAFGRLSVRVFLRVGLVFFAVSFLACGAVAAVVFFFPSGGWLYRNGAVYFAVRPLVLLGCIAGAYLITDLCGRLFSRSAEQAGTCPLTIVRSGNRVTFPALADSGNRLCERFSGLPVIVAEKRAVLPLLSPEERLSVSVGITGGLPPTLRPILYEGAGGTGLLKAFRADSIQAEHSGRLIAFEGYVAVTDKGFPGEYRAVFNPDLIRVIL